jgi:DNA-binding IclR family transcriptional regulator
MWPQAKAGIDDACVQFDGQGYVLGQGVFEKTINVVAAPFVTPDRTNVFVFNITGPSFELTPKVMKAEGGPRLLSMLQNVTSDWMRRGPSA